MQATKGGGLWAVPYIGGLRRECAGDCSYSPVCQCTRDPYVHTCFRIVLVKADEEAGGVGDVAAAADTRDGQWLDDHTTAVNGDLLHGFVRSSGGCGAWGRSALVLRVC
jgi:hypothetical protein